MNVSGIDTATQGLWDEVRQEAMNAQQTAPPAAKATNVTGQEVTGISVEAEDLDGDGVVTILERIKAQKKRSNPGTASSGMVTTALENVGPNTYERIRTVAGNAYLAQAQVTGGAEEAAASLQANV